MVRAFAAGCLALVLSLPALAEDAAITPEADKVMAKYA